MDDPDEQRVISLIGDLHSDGGVGGSAVQESPKCVGISYAELGHLVVIDGSLIAACLSMTWADYRKQVRKTKMHLGLDLNGSIPS